MRIPLSRFIAVVLIFAGIAVTHAHAQTPLKANIPAAPAGGLDPSKLPDIQGIHLGMTADQVMPLIKKLYPSPHPPTIVNVSYLGAPAIKWTAYIATDTASDCPGGAIGPGCLTKETIAATFSGAPNKSVLVKLVRSITFNYKQPPTVASLDAALKAKYGAQPVMRSPYIYYWASNEQGGPLVPAPPLKTLDCTGDTLAPAMNIKSYTNSPQPLEQLQLTQWMTVRCNNLGVYVRAWINGGPSSPFAASLDVQMTDTAEDMRDALAGEAFIEKGNAEVQKNIQKSTEKNVGPL